MLLEAAARAILRGDDGLLAAQLERAPTPATLPADLPVSGATAAATAGNPAAADEGLLFANGLGGFTQDGREYVLTLRGRERPPAPWSNVLANPGFGCLITEAGAGYTWEGNAQLNRLTPWSNDPVADPPGEALYLRDEETGEFWTPAPSPCGGEATTVVRHGQGYTRFNRTSHGLEQDLLVLVSPADPVKLVRLRVSNPGDRPRRLSATFYAEWVLGAHRDQAPLQVVCTLDPESGALFARSAWAGDFAGRVAFADVGRRPRSFTTDRAEFLGRNGAPEAPAALGRAQARRPGGRAVRPLRRADDRDGPAAGRGRRGRLLARPSGQRGRGAAARAVLRRGRPGAAGAGGGPGRMGPHPRGRPGPHPRPRAGPDAQSLADLPGACLPGMGPVGVLPVGRGVRLPRPAAGRDGPGLRRRGAGASSDPAGGGPAVRRGRRATLVAPAGGPRRSHPHLRRPVFPALRHLPPRRHHRRRGPAGRAGPVPARASPGTRSGRGLRPPRGERGDRDGLRTLRAGAGVRPEARAARPATDGHRRLERRHEPGRGRRSGRERLERVVHAGNASRVRQSGRAAQGRRACGLVPGASGGAAASVGGARLGRRLVPTGVLRRWDPSRLVAERRVPDRFDRTVMGGDLRRRRPGAGPQGDGGGRGSSGPRCGSDDSALFAAVRSRLAGARLHQRLRAGHPRKRRAVHARCHLGGAGDGSAGPGEAGARAVRPAQPGPPCRHT